VAILKHIPRGLRRLPPFAFGRRATEKNLSGPRSRLIRYAHFDTVGEREFRASPSRVVGCDEDLDPVTAKDRADEFGIRSAVGGMYDDPGHSGTSGDIIRLHAARRN
jgi:hypothetical protein